MKRCRKEHGHDALAAIAEERRRGRPAISRTQYIRRADVARTDLAHVAGARRPSEQKTERDRPDHIAQHERCDEGWRAVVPVNGVERVEHGDLSWVRRSLRTAWHAVLMARARSFSGAKSSPARLSPPWHKRPNRELSYEPIRTVVSHSERSCPILHHLSRTLRCRFRSKSTSVEGARIQQGEI